MLHVVRSFIILTTSFAVSLILFIPPAHAELIDYVRKYQSVSISSGVLERLAPYEHLINYFTSFDYFRPNHRVSADFIKALILAESSADPRAISPKGAAGLGQIILTTGQQAARELYDSDTVFRYVSRETLNNIQHHDLLDPATNILLTCYLIAKYNLKFNGKLELVLSAWNAGENTTSLSRGEHAPYRETKDLIGKVNGYYIYLLKQRGALRH